MAVAGALLLIVRSARAWTVVWVVFEPLLVVSPSTEPPELTEALLVRSVPSVTAAATLTWIVKVVVAVTPRVTERVQDTTCRAAEHSIDEPVAWKVVIGSASCRALTSPVWTDGPLLVTVRL